jgi:hypothetical protein
MSLTGRSARPLVRTKAQPPSTDEVWPTHASWLPGQQRLIMSVAEKKDRARVVQEVKVLTVSTGEQRVLLQDAADARYLPTGHLLFSRGSVGALAVAALDVTTLALGPPVRLWQDILF